MPDLLLELFSEEIPARMQARAAADLKKLLCDALVESGLTYQAAAAFVTPRRLCLSIAGLAAESAHRVEERKGPRTDAPEKAVEGFLRATGISRDRLEIRDDRKGAIFVATIRTPGRRAAEVVAEQTAAVIRDFPWPKSMRWGAGGLRWVRPLHSILCILHDEAGAEIVEVAVDGVPCGDTTEGHRFMGRGRFAVTSFEDYAARLKRDFVLLDADERADHIWIEAHNMAFAQGLEVVEDKALLAEVAGLVEWPVVLIGDIAPEFLDLPAEVLQTSMRNHQKFFSVRNPKSGRIEKFVTVANRETADQGATILAGNRKVLFARLSDARFFWENDLRTIERAGLEGMAAGLADVTFHNKLGSQAERVKRIEALARDIARRVNAVPDLAAEAARIAKADLQSEMVAEFPELQGLMGMYYARAAGHDDGVPEACAEHYSPLGPNDSVPSAPVSVAVALADKIDTLCGFWAIDEKPTGSKDPFALRRAALGVIRLVLENRLRIGLSGIVATAFGRSVFAREITLARQDDQPFPADNLIRQFPQASIPGEEADKADDLLAFLHDRLKVHLRDQGIRHDVIDACLAMPGNDDLTLLVKRATALAAFLKTDDGENLLQGYKRANNILTAEEKKDGVAYEGAPEERFAEDPGETALFQALDRAEAAIATALRSEDFAAAMTAMAALRAPIDAFFTAVQVNTDKQILRRNRLCLLNRIREVMGQAAHFPALEG